MIKIENIKTYNGIHLTIDDLKNSFHDRILNMGRTNPKKELFKLLKSTKRYKGLKKKNWSKFVRFLIKDFSLLINGAPDELQNIIDTIENKFPGYLGLEDKTTGKFTSSAFGKEILRCFGYENRFRSIPEKGGWLAKNLNIKSCPFCNAQYTLYAENADKKGLSRFQFDHFFPKNRYPYLSVSVSFP